MHLQVVLIYFPFIFFYPYCILSIPLVVKINMSLCSWQKKVWLSKTATFSSNQSMQKTQCNNCKAEKGNLTPFCKKHEISPLVPKKANILDRQCKMIIKKCCLHCWNYFQCIWNSDEMHFWKEMRTEITGDERETTLKTDSRGKSEWTSYQNVP